MNIPLISVVLGTFNQKTVLQTVLPMYGNQSLSPSDFEVIVVDSSSTDGAVQWLQAYALQAPFTLKILVQNNQGKAWARNDGVAMATGKWIVITDADMIPHPDFLAHHLEAQQQTAVPTCFEGLTYNFYQLEWPTDKGNLTPLIPHNPPTNTTLGWYYCLTGNLSLPKIVFEAFKGFDTDFTGYGWEDLELGYRMSKKKIPLRYLQEAINYHYHVISKDQDIERHWHKGVSAKTLLSKHPQLKWFLGLNPLSVALFLRIKESGFIYTSMQKWYGSASIYKHRFGFWFLKEYRYLKGLLS